MSVCGWIWLAWNSKRRKPMGNSWQRDDGCWRVYPCCVIPLDLGRLSVYRKFHGCATTCSLRTSHVQCVRKIPTHWDKSINYAEREFRHEKLADNWLIRYAQIKVAVRFNLIPRWDFIINSNFVLGIVNGWIAEYYGLSSAIIRELLIKNCLRYFPN